MKRYTMKKLLFGLLLLAGSSVGAQGIRNDNIEFNGQKYPCYVYEYQSKGDMVEDAIKEKMQKAGNKPTKGPKGWLVYRNVLIPGNAEAGMKDVFVKVDDNSKKEDVKSKVYLIATKPGEIPEEKLSKADRDNTTEGIILAAGGAAFLTTMDENVGEKQFSSNLKAQEGLVEKEDQKLKNLKDKQNDLEKKLKDLQEDMSKNLQEQEKQAGFVEREKAKLEEMKAKVGGGKKD